MDSYSKIFQEHQGKITDKWSSYLYFYDSCLSNLTPNKILEIGVQNGGSLEVWATLYPNADLIVGIDIDEKCGSLVFEKPQISVIVGDIKSAETKNKVNGLTNYFDLIIDDGSHTSSDIIAALINYLPLLTPGGKFIIEDLHASYWRTWEGGLFRGRSAINFLKRVVDVINFEHWDQTVSVKEYLSHFHDLSDDFLRTLRQIKRITFENSTCVIELGEESENASVGLRVITGFEAQVTPNPLAQTGATISDFIEKSDSESSNKDAYLDPDSIENLKNRNQALEFELDTLIAERDSLVRSWSWRITKPARILLGIFR